MGNNYLSLYMSIITDDIFSFSYKYILFTLEIIMV